MGVVEVLVAAAAVVVAVVDLASRVFKEEKERIVKQLPLILFQ